VADLIKDILSAMQNIFGMITHAHFPGVNAWFATSFIYLSIDRCCFQIVIDCHRHHRSILEPWQVMVRFGSVQYMVVHIAIKVDSMPQYSKRICRWNWEIYIFWGKSHNRIPIPNKILNGIHSQSKPILKILQWNARSLKPLIAFADHERSFYSRIWKPHSQHNVNIQNC
jgi:hypothetical protein